MAGIERAQRQRPFAPGPAERRQADDAERGDQKSQHRDRHPAADAGHLADLRQVMRDVDGAGAEEQRDLSGGMHGDLQPAADDAGRRRERRAENDIGELADGRIGEPRLQIVAATAQ